MIKHSEAEAPERFKHCEGHYFGPRGEALLDPTIDEMYPTPLTKLNERSINKCNAFSNPGTRREKAKHDFPCLFRSRTTDSAHIYLNYTERYGFSREPCL